MKNMEPTSNQTFQTKSKKNSKKIWFRLTWQNLQTGVGEIMRRMVFVSTEFDTNADAVEVAIASPEIGGNDKGLTKVWWDKK